MCIYHGTIGKYHNLNSNVYCFLDASKVFDRYFYFYQKYGCNFQQ